jgi:putative Mn2+ efflux pump MntP
MTWKVLALVVPLGLDTFAVAAALGIAGLDRRQRLRVSLLFTAFEGGMPLIGLIGGTVIGGLVGNLADLIAIALLIALGIFMLVSRADDEEARAALLARTQGLPLIGLGLSISLDELAIGFTLGLVKDPIALAVALIAIQGFVVAQVGLRLGSRVEEAVREGAERVAGLVLVLLGLGLAVARLAGIQL